MKSIYLIFFFFKRFFMNSKETADICDLPTRFIDGVWNMLAQLNSAKRMIDVPLF